MSGVKRFVAIVALTIFYRLASLVSQLRVFRGARRQGPIMLIGTFHNPNWVWAHVEPIARSDAAPVILITDEPIGELPNLTCLCAPVWAQRIFSRAGAKFFWSLYAGLRYRPSMMMGYHVFPAGVIALIAGTLCGARTSFQVTAGQLELEGGGWHAENPLLVALQRDSLVVERAVLQMCRQFDLLVVRGSQAESYLRSNGCKGDIETITGSVIFPDSLDATAERDIDLLFIGRLTEYKRPDRFIEVMRKLVERRPSVKAVMLGEGPDRPEIEAAIQQYSLESNIEMLGQRDDVEDFQYRAKIMILTSRWEGVSIAMLESMARAAVPVVPDVGDLRDFVSEDTGALLDENDIDGYVEAICRLLDDPERLHRCGRNARDLVGRTSSKSAVQAKWHRVFSEYQDAQIQAV